MFKLPTLLRNGCSAYLALGAVAVVWGAAFPFLDYLFHPAPNAPPLLPPLTHVTLRYLIASVGLLPVIGWHVARYGFPTPKRLLRMTVFGLVGVMGYQLPLLYGLALDASVITACLIVNFSPVVVALLGSMALGERIARAQALGIALGMAGVATVVVWNHDTSVSGSINGAAFILLAPICFGVYTVLTRKETRTEDPLALASWHTLLATLAIVPVTLVIEPEATTCLTTLGAQGWLSLLYLGGLSSAGGLLVWCWALKRLHAARVSVTVYAVPVVAALTTWLFRDRIPTVGFWTGGALIFAGLYLVQRTVKPDDSMPISQSAPEVCKP